MLLGCPPECILFLQGMSYYTLRIFLSRFRVVSDFLKDDDDDDDDGDDDDDFLICWDLVSVLVLVQ